MKRALSLLLVAVLLLGTAACARRGAGKSITYPLAASPATLDPQYTNDAGALTVINNVFEGLTRLDAKGSAVPALAESWDCSEDGLTYTFHLKSGTEWYCPLSMKNEFGDDFYQRFSKETVTAADFAFALRRTLDPATASPHAHRLLVLKNAAAVAQGMLPPEQLGVNAPDADTLILQLTAPCEDLPERLTESACMPCNEDFFTAMGGRYGMSPRHILCNGPFYVSSWDSETALTIKKNNYYSGKEKALPATVVFSFDPDLNSVAAKLTNGTLSAAMLPPEIDTPEGCTELAQRKNNTFGLLLNCADPLLSNADLRIALCAAMDRDLFLTEDPKLLPERGLVPASCMAGGVSYRDAVGAQTAGIGRDPTAAALHFSRALSALSTDRITLTLLCPTAMESQAMQQVQLWQRMLGLNFTLNLELRTAEEITAAVDAGTYQLAFSGVTAEEEEAALFLASFADGDVFGLRSKDYDNLLDALMNATDRDGILTGCFAAESYLLSQGVCYPLYSRAGRFVLADDVAGITMPGGESTISFLTAKRFD